MPPKFGGTRYPPHQLQSNLFLKRTPQDGISKKPHSKGFKYFRQFLHSIPNVTVSIGKPFDGSDHEMFKCSFPLYVCATTVLSHSTCRHIGTKYLILRTVRWSSFILSSNPQSAAGDLHANFSPTIVYSFRSFSISPRSLINFVGGRKNIWRPRKSSIIQETSRFSHKLTACNKGFLLSRTNV